MTRCPYGVTGDRLWVRETWYPEKSNKGPASYRATWPIDDEPPDDGWKPAIFMPRWASRIALEILSVRVGRLHDISEADAEAEGCEMDTDGMPKQQLHESGIGEVGWDSAQEWFADLWDSINSERGFGWETNPFVFRIEFRMVTAG